MRTADNIKNIGIFAHVDAGKTSITEQMLYLCGKIRKVGNVDDGTTQTDWLSIERERGISVRAAATELEWKNYFINLIDTPGHVDFAGEVDRSMMALDGAVLVLSAVEGIQSHTENLWNAFQTMQIPCILFLNKIDRAGSHTMKLVSELETRFQRKFLCFCTPQKEESIECQVRYVEKDLYEELADSYDDVAEWYLDGKKLREDFLQKRFAEAVQQRKIVPVFCGSARMGIGIDHLLDAIIRYLPSASTKTEQELSGIVFKIEHDKAMGKIAHVRMYGGSIKSRDSITVQHSGMVVTDEDKESEKVTQIRKFNGQKYVDTGEVNAGDIAALCGLNTAKTGDSIGIRRKQDAYHLANPFLMVKVSPQTPTELTPLVNAIRELSEEDPLIDYRWEKSEREIQIHLTGEIQLEVIALLLKERYGLTAQFSSPSVIYKETPSKAGEGLEAYTMPKPCWAVVHFAFEPLPRGSGVVYEGGSVPHNQLFYKYQTHIKTSFFNSLEQGLYGWEVTDFKATLIGGEHHTLHTHPLDFFVATPMAIMNGLSNTGTTLLEPILKVRITAGEEFLGKIIRDITLMRGKFENPVIQKDVCQIEAYLPVATSMEYPIHLATMTSGKAIYASFFHGYQECSLSLGATTPRRGINPLDRARWILAARGAL